MYSFGNEINLNFEKPNHGVPHHFVKVFFDKHIISLSLSLSLYIYIYIYIYVVVCSFPLANPW
jgi:hypothetical protein